MRCRPPDPPGPSRAPATSSRRGSGGSPRRSTGPDRCPRSGGGTRPRWRRAKSQLKSAVRAPPTWRCPVGLGAKRTRTDSPIGTPILEEVTPRSQGTEKKKKKKKKKKAPRLTRGRPKSYGPVFREPRVSSGRRAVPSRCSRRPGCGSVPRSDTTGHRGRRSRQTAPRPPGASGAGGA